MSKTFQFVVESGDVPIVELTDAGLYVRFVSGVDVAKTIIRNKWPHIAIDLDEAGAVIGIESVPVPDQFSINKIAKDAGVKMPKNFRPNDIQIKPRQSACAPVPA